MIAYNLPRDQDAYATIHGFVYQVDLTYDPALDGTTASRDPRTGSWRGHRPDHRHRQRPSGSRAVSFVGLLVHSSSAAMLSIGGAPVFRAICTLARRHTTHRPFFEAESE